MKEYEGLEDYILEAQHEAVAQYFARHLHRDCFYFSVVDFKDGAAKVHLVSYDEWDNNPDEVMAETWSDSVENTIKWCAKMCKSWSWE